MTTDAQTQPAGRSWWSLGLWAAQIALALLYLAAGGAKLTQPIDALAAAGMSFVIHLPEAVTRIIGILEIMGAAGLILPAATRILPRLTPLAAIGLSLVQVGAIVTHALLGETAMTLPMNLVLLALSMFIAWGRTRKETISPR